MKSSPATKILREELQKLVNPKAILIVGLREHSKASERYADVVFYYSSGQWDGSIPFHYRRAGLFLEDSTQIANLIKDAYEASKPQNARKWIDGEKRKWNQDRSGKTVTKPFFDALLSLRWSCVDSDLPKNRNWARRIQDIKEMGYILATHTHYPCKKCGRNTTHILLIPLKVTTQTGYELITPALRKRIQNILGYYDAFEGKVRHTDSLIPDHKFPEISWDPKTRQKNLESLTDEEIRAKFQLLDNQRNLQKREVSRQIFQTGKRGTIFGIKYYYVGGEEWPRGISRFGKKSEAGWIGSPWYDIEKWRQSLNRDIERWRQMEKDIAKIKKENEELRKKLGKL